MSSGRQISALLVIIVLCLAAGGIGGITTAPAIASWYAELRKPSWTPPNWVFGPVWTFLYLTMAVAAWLVWRRRLEVNVTLPIVLFGVQLALNLAWSLIFFGRHLPGLAFLDIVLLWTAILLTTLTFWRVSTVAGVLMVPYILWVSYASTLNYGVWRING